MLPLSDLLSPRAKTSFVLSGLSNESLLSVGQFCNDNCIAIFTKNKMYLLKQNKITLQGNRNFSDGLWDVKLPTVPPPPPISDVMDMHYIITKNKSKTHLAQYLHATIFSPSITTFTKSITNENFVTRPGIGNLNVSTLLGTTTTTELSHLDQERYNLQSTQQQKYEEEDFSF